MTLSALTARARAWTPHLLVVFVLVHLAASVVDVFPDVSIGLNRAMWREARVRHEIDVWAARLGWDRGDFEQRLWTLAETLRDTRTVLRAPFVPYLALSGVRQSWAMFAAGTPAADRFQMHARACAGDSPCEWVPVFGVGGADEILVPALNALLAQARIRSATFRWGWPRHQRSYRHGCEALAAVVFRARPDMLEVQCGFERRVTTHPGERMRAPRVDRKLVIRRAA